MEWTAQQEQARDDVNRWLRGGTSPTYYLGGYAGTGKTTIAKDLAEGVHGRVLYGAYTGKAAQVMRSKGCTGAQTIHSLIYAPRTELEQELTRLQEELLQMVRDQVPLAKVAKVEEAIRKVKIAMTRPKFALRPNSPLQDAALLVVDECSMVSKEVGFDLLSFGVPILALGDPAQLPPVRAEGYFGTRKPDFLLTDIVRQAAENPVLYLSMLAREGKPIPYGWYGDSRVVRHGEISLMNPADVPSNSQILVGLRATRHRCNTIWRKRLGIESPIPVKGDRLLCGRNSYDLDLLNGSTWTVEEVPLPPCQRMIGLRIKSEDDGSMRCVCAHDYQFFGEDIPPESMRDAEDFSYAYAMTTHKAQGSEWDDVTLADESHRFRNTDSRKLLYTGITRAVKRITIRR